MGDGELARVSWSRHRREVLKPVLKLHQAPGLFTVPVHWCRRMVPHIRRLWSPYAATALLCPRPHRYTYLQLYTYVQLYSTVALLARQGSTK